ncbi:MAG TPA: TrmH family RNA methyltransferase [Balneolaceae bacterium]|nr:TrmH family RNA methyltransferase [Balneolaceae bacterium]
MYRKLTAKEILIYNRQRQSPLKDHFILWLHNIRSLHNVGAAFRSADAFGINELRLSGYTPAPPRAEISKTALGAEKDVKWMQIDTSEVEDEISLLKTRAFTILGLEQTKESIFINDYNPADQKICLILGNEVTGIDESLFPYIDEMIEIPQFGTKHSLNVSVAAGIALYAFFEKLQ